MKTGEEPNMVAAQPGTQRLPSPVKGWILQHTFNLSHHNRVFGDDSLKPTMCSDIDAQESPLVRRSCAAGRVAAAAAAVVVAAAEWLSSGGGGGGG